LSSSVATSNGRNYSDAKGFKIPHLVEAFAEFQNETISYAMSVRLFVRMEQLGSYLADLYEI